MTYYRDLTPFVYDSLPSDEALEEMMKQAPEPLRDTLRNNAVLRGAVNVGWLGRWRWFKKGRTSEEFKEALFRLCRDPSMPGHRGYHRCTFCFSSPRTLGTPESRGGVEVLLGSKVLAIRGPERNYAAPNLIYHYVERHRYKPPAEFIEAVLAQARSVDL